MKKQTFTIQEHLKNAKSIRLALDYFTQLYIETSKHCPLNSKIVRLAKKEMLGVRLMISEFENLVFKDYPNLPDKATGIYYGIQQPFDESKAKALAAELTGQAEIATLIGGDPEKDAIESVLIEAFAKYNIETIKRAFKLYSDGAGID